MGVASTTRTPTTTGMEAYSGGGGGALRLLFSACARRMVF